MSKKNYSLSVICAVLCLLSISNNAFAQEQGSPEYHWVCEDLKNTYQIVLTERAMINLPIDICDKIEAAREENKRAVIQYSPYLKIIVLSRKEVEKNTTVKEIIYEN
jgi:hypothetical protein